MTIAVLVAMVTFGYAVGSSGSVIAKRIGESVGPVAAVILIVGAGGGFKQTLIGAGVGDSVAKFANGAHLSVLLLGWLIAVSLRLATGSATVATITTAGIVAPLAVGTDPQPRRPPGPRHRRRLAVPLSRQRRGILAGQGAVRTHRRTDVQELVDDGDRGLGRRVLVRHVALGGGDLTTPLLRQKIAAKVIGDGPAR